MSDGHEPETKLNRAEDHRANAGRDIYRVFFGPDGLRPGWSLLVFVLVYGALSICLSTLAAAFLPMRPKSPGVLTPGFVLRGEGVALSAVLLATWIMARIEGRGFASYGLAPGRWRERAGAGALFGLALLALLVGGLRISGYLVFESRLLHWGRGLQFALEWGFMFLLVGLSEETLFRGYLQFALTRALASLYGLFGVPAPAPWGFWTSAVLLSFGFGAVHTENVGESPVGIAAACIIGVIFCLSLWRTGSLWWAIGFHAAWDWAESFLFGVYDSGTLAQGRLFQTHPQGGLLLSGGLTGPEGSVLVLPTLLVMALAIFITAPRSRALSPHEEQDRSQAAI